ncbi:transcriptional regulator [Gallibacterium genomosp. 3]|uniref:Transcriptional regulator n=1 Tax=Gallibacterium genomosp. 3 TaxID=505345 RepID=A0A1A7NT10_9PAST|nr:DNA-binding transcriptional regulator KdgR [Gallibacterium genomosp. 3]OBW92651.1 transcriptional regulator [Gallibacterium genomosp. 3]OBX05730.1 transcriptional regulator [Gallibacterium genomosp. 3]OBX10850.1 transcriptional regulator [Gallibacterium genomosp. 3]
MKKENTSLESVASVLKVFSILEILSEQKDIGITELSQKLMMSKSTTYRFLQTMKNLGYVYQENDSDKYGLSLKLFELSARSLEYVDLISFADKEMQYISEQTGEALHLGILDGHEIVYLHKIDSKYNLRMQSRIGRRNPLYSTGIGKVLLSDMSDDEVRNILSEVKFVQYTKNTVDNIEKLIPELHLVREHHYAEDNEEQEDGLICIAAPVYNRLGKIIAGLSISLPSIRFKEKDRPYLVNLLQQAGKHVSERLGFYGYPTNK